MKLLSKLPMFASAAFIAGTVVGIVAEKMHLSDSLMGLMGKDSK